MLKKNLTFPREYRVRVGRLAAAAVARAIRHGARSLSCHFRSRHALQHGAPLERKRKCVCWIARLTSVQRTPALKSYIITPRVHSAQHGSSSAYAQKTRKSLTSRQTSNATSRETSNEISSETSNEISSETSNEISRVTSREISREFTRYLCVCLWV